MEITISSRKLGKRIIFSRHGNYIYVNLGKPRQICEGGELMGRTISYSGDDEQRFETLCRNWWKLYLRENGECY